MVPSKSTTLPVAAPSSGASTSSTPLLTTANKAVPQRPQRRLTTAVTVLLVLAAAAAACCCCGGGSHCRLSLLLESLALWPPATWLNSSGATHPFCRKSTPIGVLPGRCSNDSLDLVLWSGIGKHKAILPDAWAFDLKRHDWRFLNPACPPDSACPIPRWKSGNALTVPGALVVVGGDAYTPGTRHHAYENAVWRLDYATLQWSKAYVDPGSPAPAARRGHSTVLYTDKDGIPHVVLFAGRTRDKVLLNDAWDGALTWPNVTWRQVAPQLPAGQAPAPRRGHSAVLVQEAAAPQMLVYGGREDLDYFADAWLLDITSGKWAVLEPAGGEAPPGRDHHSVAYVHGKMWVWGGRSGPTYGEAKALNEMWSFHVGTAVWERVRQQGRVPLPRFEQSYVQYTPLGCISDSRLLVFGGQTEHVCQLNDVWEFSFNTGRWAELSPPQFCTKKCAKRYLAA